MVWTMRETKGTACQLIFIDSWQPSGSSFTSVINPLFPRWPQCISLPWNQKKLSTFHSAIIFADLPQSSVSCQVSERRRDGASNSFKSHCRRWLFYFQIFCCSPLPSDHKSRIWPREQAPFIAVSPVQLMRQTTPRTLHRMQEASWLFKDLFYKDQNIGIRESNP